MKPQDTQNIQGRTFLETINEHARLPWIILFGTTLVIAVLLFPNLLMTTPRYEVGDVVQKDIKSPKDFLVEDKEATQRRRDEAAQSTLSIYDFDDTLLTKLDNRVREAFRHMQGLLSPESAGAGQVGQKAKNAPTAGSKKSTETLTAHDLVWREKPDFETQLGTQLNKSDYKVLEKYEFSDVIAQGISLTLRTVLQEGVVADKTFLLKELQKGIIVRNLSSNKEARVTDLQRFYGLHEAKSAVSETPNESLKDMARPLRKLILDIARNLIQPNLTLNKGETEERRKQAIAAVKQVLTQVKRGEMLVREGEKISQLHMSKLQALGAETRKENLFSISAGFMLLVIAFFVISYATYFGSDMGLALKNKDLLFLCLMLVIIFILAEVSVYLVKGIGAGIPYSAGGSPAYYTIPVAVAPMTVCLFLGIRVSLTFALAASFAAAFLFPNEFDMLIFFFLSGVLGAYWVRNCKERGVLIKAGLKVGLVNVLLVTALHMFRGGNVEVNLMWSWGFGLLGGTISGILVAGFAPVVEMTFAYTTDIKLLELANLDRPILRKLMLEAPGTYHHSVIVGSLVEAAAAAIGANPLLARVSGYYHDIGKIRKPLYFIENQAGRENRHDKLAPSMSSLILIAHVRDGVEIARNHRLGTAIINIVQQHHGTSVISYFFEKAKQMRGEDAVSMEDFKYPGPKPQTKEAGLVLLADAVEAASRALDNPTPSRIKGLVQRIINKIFLDGQLDECELTLRDLHEIASSFNKILNGIHHHRIEYPEIVAKGGYGTNEANGSPSKKQAKPSNDIPEGDKEKGDYRLKRLGMR